MSEASGTETLKSQIQSLLGRIPETEKLKTGKFIAKYVEYGMSPASLVADTEEGAMEKLLAHLLSKKPTK